MEGMIPSGSRCGCLSVNPNVALFAEAPVVKVTRKADYDGLETLVCQVHGFYPKEIEANWVKDGEVWQEGTLRGLVAPNSDGTYYLLLSVQIDPEERERFRCRVEHDSLEKPLDVAWEKEPGERQTGGEGVGSGRRVSTQLLRWEPQLDPVCVSRAAVLNLWVPRCCWTTTPIIPELWIPKNIWGSTG
uniref:Ig-like domain-containing protein n=1 Tax=Podarcis muralis TaxID=64176 RepID=A0A670HPS2_PODMU